jgi:uncharacterized protein YoxC
MGRKKDVKKKIDKLFDLFNEIEEIGNNVYDDVSKLDKELSSIYHKIEGMEEGHMERSSLKEMKNLQRVLLKRRAAKRDARLARSVIDRLNQHVTGSVKKHKEICQKHVDLTEEIRERSKD